MNRWKKRNRKRARAHQQLATMDSIQVEFAAAMRDVFRCFQVLRYLLSQLSVCKIKININGRRTRLMPCFFAPKGKVMISMQNPIEPILPIEKRRHGDKKAPVKGRIFRIATEEFVRVWK